MGELLKKGTNGQGSTTQGDNESALVDVDETMSGYLKE